MNIHERAQALGLGTGTVSEILDVLERTQGELEGADILHDVEKQAHAKTKAVVEDLRMLVSRLAKALRKAAPDNELPGKALDYLIRNGLVGSPLRKVGAGETAVTREMIVAAHDVMLAKGDFVLSAALLERIFLAMDAVRHNAQVVGLAEGQSHTNAVLEG